VSRTITWKLAELVFECESVALQVTSVLAIGNFVPEAGRQAAGVGPSTASFAVGVGKLTLEPPGPFASTMRSPETPVSAGPMLSVTVTVKLPLCVFTGEAVSLAEQLTVVTPVGNALPDAGTQLTGTEPATVSDAVAEYVTALPELESASTCMFAGRLSTGFVSSLTVTVKETGELVVFPLASWALQFTVVVPRGKVFPEPGAQFTLGDGSPLSVAEGDA
jgi:hypothetical protein